MKVTRQQVVAVVGFVASSLLLVFAVNCSFEKRAVDGTKQEQATEELAGQKTDEEIVVANEFCSACHYGFDEEELALNHRLAGIGCERCHGESERHRSDEDNITPPEIMYPRAKIIPTCMMCHPRHEIRHVADHKTLLAGAKTVFDPSDEGGNQMYCTDCHARDHRINVRTIRWNKETGELLNE